MTCLAYQQGPGRSQSNRAVLYQASTRHPPQGGPQGLNNKPSRGSLLLGGPVMAEAIAERVRRYILDGSDEDLRRLLGVAETTKEMARSAFRRVDTA